MTGKQLITLMRLHKVTIRELARRMNVTLKSVRLARRDGSTFPGCLDYAEAIRGMPGLTPEEQRRLAMWRAV